MKTVYFIPLIIFSLIIILTIDGCALGHKISRPDYELGKQRTATVGSSMLTYISGTSNPFDSELLDKGIKEELVYSGKSGNTIKVDYRQYYRETLSAWYIKDGFTQHLEYDLSSSDMITYKNYKIKVLDSNSSEIKFIVMEH